MGTGVTLTVFHIWGMKPSRMELLKIAARGAAMSGAQSFNIQFGVLSGPGDLLVFMEMSFLSTCSTDIMKFGGIGNSFGEWGSLGRSLVDDK